MVTINEVIIKANTLEEALSEAELKLRVPRNSMEIEYISQGNTGFWGFGKKQIVIRAKVKMQFGKKPVIKELVNPKKTDKIPSLDGSIEVKDGQVFVTGSKGFGRLPSIMAGNNVEVYINEKKVEIPRPVNEEDHVEVKTKNAVPSIKYDVEVSQDKMHAYLIIKRELGQIYEIVDCKPTLELKVMAKFVREENPKPIDYSQVISLLESKGIVRGIKEMTISLALNSQEQEVRVEVASGIMPQGVEDAEIVYNFSIEDSERRQNPYGEGTIKSISEGEILAIKKPSVQGIPGFDIQGNVVPPRTPKEEVIRIKEGVKLIKDDTVAIATIYGRPILEGTKNKVLSVRPAYIVHGDVNLEVGNLKYKGDIIVKGSVLDGFRLEAGGRIEVLGDVLCADLYANGNIVIHNKAISANIQAGGLTVTYKQVDQTLKNLLQRIDDLFRAMETLKQQKAFTMTDLKEKGDGQLVQLLIDLKFKDIPIIVGQLSNILENSLKELTPEVREVEQSLIQKLCNLGPLRIKDKIEFEELIPLLKQSIETVNYIITNTSNVAVNYVQNSVVSASGDIVIAGQGSVASELVAEDRILIEKGIVRGGYLTAHKMIIVQELGSSSGSNVEVIINMLGDCRLKANHIHPGVAIKHGTQTRVINEKIANFEAYVTNENYLTFSI